MTDPDFALGLGLIVVSASALLLAAVWPRIVPDNTARRIRRLAWEEGEAERASPADMVPRLPVRLRAQLEGLLRRWRLGSDELAHKLRMAGYRQRKAPLVFFAAKLGTPLIVLPFALAYLEAATGASTASNLVLAASLAGLSFWLPEVLLANLVQRRQARIEQGWPDTLDLLHMCMSAGMSLEAALAKVTREIRRTAPDIAAELTLTISELTYLQDRRKALENLGERTGIRAVREVVAALIQSQRFGAALGDTLRLLAKENRAQRLAEAEKKAATLAPKLTVPMIVFFLPALFVVIATPAAIELLDLP